MKVINSMFTVLTPKFLLTATDEEVTEKSSILVKEYEEDLSDDLTFQVNSFRIALKSEIETNHQSDSWLNYCFSNVTPWHQAYHQTSVLLFFCFSLFRLLSLLLKDPFQS